jgi:hypothetical protein
MNGFAPDLSGLIPAIVVFFAIAAIGTLVSVAVIASTTIEFVTSNHRLRVARHQSIATYYARLVHRHSATPFGHA